jgi:sugar (pentulose or hexulose) kinase
VASGDDALWLGIDLGTQGVRVLVASSDGEVVARASRPLTGERDGERHEQDPASWWESAAAACREAMEDLEPDRVQGVATDATSGTILLVNAEGHALTPAVMYDDARAGEQGLRADAAGEELWRSLGYRMAPGWALPKLLWMIECRPELIPGARLAHASDLINGRLVGHEVATDWSHALKTGYDLIEDSWPWAVLDRLAVPSELLPKVVSPGTVLGGVGGLGASQTGLSAGTPVVAGMTDGCASQIATGALAEGSWSSMLGTTLGLKGASAELVRDSNGVLYCHRSPDGGWLPGGACNVGAAVLSNTFGDEHLDELGDRSARIARRALPVRCRRGGGLPPRAAEGRRRALRCAVAGPGVPRAAVL